MALKIADLFEVPLTFLGVLYVFLSWFGVRLFGAG